MKKDVTDIIMAIGWALYMIVLVSGTIFLIYTFQNFWALTLLIFGSMSLKHKSNKDKSEDDEKERT